MTLARNVATVGTATLMSRLLGFFRDVGIAALFGSSPFAQAFFALLQLINFFRRLLAEGAVNGAFAPIWLRLRGQGGQNRFTRRVLLLVAIGSILLTIVALAASPLVIRAIAPGFEDDLIALTWFFSIYALPYIALAGPVAIIAAALNAEGRVGAVACGTVAFNAVMVIAVAMAYSDYDGEGVLTGIWLSAAIFVSGLTQLLIVAAAWFWRGQRLRRVPAQVAADTSKEIRRFFRRAVPSLIAAGIPQLKLLVGAAVASSSAAGVSWLYYANRLYELPLGVVSIAIASVLVPLIAQSVHSGDVRETARAQSRAFEIALGLALPAAVAFAVLAEPIAGGLFQRGAFGPHDTAAVAAALAAISAGLPGHVLEKVLGAVSFAHEDTRTPMIAALCGLATALAGALLLFPHYGHVGVAAAIAVSGWVGASIMLVVLIRRRWLRVETGVWWRLPGIVLATAVMAAAIGGAQMLFETLAGPAPAAAARIGGLIVLVAVGLAVYLATTQALGIVRIAALIAAARQRL
jgi:putative peptidoglycan lipid II flippase